MDGVFPPAESMDGQGERGHSLPGPLLDKALTHSVGPGAGWGHGRKGSAEAVLPSPKVPHPG